MKFESLAMTVNEINFDDRYAWIETIDDSVLASRLKLLKKSDLELLTLISFDGYNQSAAARLLGCSQKNISVKLTRIKKFLKNI